MKMDNIILHKYDSENGFTEIIPKLGNIFPQILQIDASGIVSWSHDDLVIFKSHMDIMEDTTRDLFIVIDEQQKRIDELTDKLNTVINFLK